MFSRILSRRSVYSLCKNHISTRQYKQCKQINQFRKSPNSIFRNFSQPFCTQLIKSKSILDYKMGRIFIFIQGNIYFFNSIKTGRILIRLLCWNIGMLVGATFVISEPFLIIKGVYRFVCSFAVGLVIGIDYKLNSGENVSEEDMNKLHKRSALRLLRLFEYNKGIFIKFGQHLAALDYLLPEEYTTVMQTLQNHAPTCEFSAIDKVFVQELGKSAHEL